MSAVRVRPGALSDDPFLALVAGAPDREHESVSTNAPCIPSYEILSQLGQGGMGTVYLAWDVRLERRVALKLLSHGLAADDSARRRFLLEARAAAALEHPNICTIYAVDETPDGQVYIAMSYCEGQTLQQRLANGPLSVGE